MDDRQIDRLRALLMEWDAIGVSDLPGNEDEYDCMIAPVIDLLGAGADVSTLHEWVMRERVDHLGLRPEPESDLVLARLLAATRSGAVGAVPERPIALSAACRE